VITGAAFGIGRATAELFAREGARLIATDIQGDPLLALADELRHGGAEVETVVGDVSVEKPARRMIGAAADRFGRLDVLVANAGLIPLGDATEVTTADWEHVMAIDGRGMFLTCKFAIDAMVPTGGGAIVCLSSSCQIRCATAALTAASRKSGGISCHSGRHQPARWSACSSESIATTYGPPSTR
jgi:NAD(P)-dependent dehydrogenase (short-subunit alcohol dehydrogenase family)